MKFNALTIEHGFTESKTGKTRFRIEDDVLYTIPTTTFDSVVNGAIESIEFKIGKELPVTEGRPPIKSSFVSEVTLTDMGKTLNNMKKTRVDIEEKKLKKELEAI